MRVHHHLLRSSLLPATPTETARGSARARAAAARVATATTSTVPPPISPGWRPTRGTASPVFAAACASPRRAAVPRGPARFRARRTRPHAATASAAANAPAPRTDTICEGALACGQNIECSNACKAKALLTTTCVEPTVQEITPSRTASFALPWSSTARSSASSSPISPTCGRHSLSSTSGPTATSSPLVFAVSCRGLASPKAT